MKDTSSGAMGILGLAGAAIIFFVMRKFFPALSMILLIILGILLLLVVVLVVLVIFFSRQKPEEKEDSKASADRKAILTRGHSNLMEIRRLAVRVRNPQIRALSEEICRTADKILRTLKSQPEDIPTVRQFLNYYLPTMGSILTKYVRVQESGVPTADLEESAIACLGNIKNAMEKQYANLFEDDILDLTVEMEVLTLACKRDGLLVDEYFRDDGQDITLTL